MKLERCQEGDALSPADSSVVREVDRGIDALLKADAAFSAVSVEAFVRSVYADPICQEDVHAAARSLDRVVQRLALLLGQVEQIPTGATGAV